LNQGDVATAQEKSQTLDEQVSGSVEKLQAWFATR